MRNKIFEINIYIEEECKFIFSDLLSYKDKLLLNLFCGTLVFIANELITLIIIFVILNFINGFYQYNCENEHEHIQNKENEKTKNIPLSVLCNFI